MDLLVKELNPPVPTSFCGCYSYNPFVETWTSLLQKQCNKMPSQIKYSLILQSSCTF